MSKINEMDYRYQCCPFCKSKRVIPKNMYDEFTKIDHTTGRANGYFCKNCNRWHPDKDTIYKTDRVEIRRDIKNLQKLLI